MQAPIDLTVGGRFRSQVCDTEIMVIRPGSRPVALACGGHPVVGIAVAASVRFEPDERFRDGTQIGKRYTHPEDSTLEILVTKAGIGTLSDGDTPLVTKSAKPLPASD
jgi:hypothetical protein